MSSYVHMWVSIGYAMYRMGRGWGEPFSMLRLRSSICGDKSAIIHARINGRQSYVGHGEYVSRYVTQVS